MMRLRYILIGIVSAGVGITTVTSMIGLEPSGGETPRPIEEASVRSMTLQTPSTQQALPREGEVYVVRDQTVKVDLEVTGVKEVLVQRDCDKCDAAKFSTKLYNDDEKATVEVRLPEANRVYTLTGVGFVDDRQVLAWKGDYYDQRAAVPAGAKIRIMVASP